MATLPVSAARIAESRHGALPPRAPAYVWACAGASILGVVAIWPTSLALWSLWTTDALKSIGGLVPLVSLLLILRVWRALGWQAAGSGWGVLLLAATSAVVALRQGVLLELVLGPSWSLTLPPHSLVALAYAAGWVLLAGGPRLLRAAAFPVLLMLLVNPVPHVFNTRVDLPLQHAAAAVARGLAHALGQRLTPDQLSLMFTPQFGMFIAPGCNGIRGAITLGLIALVAGYLYRFRRGPWALLVGGAVLLGYLFNLVRLCALVLFYVLALHWPFLQAHAEGADYLLGAALFFLAAMALFSAIRRFTPGHSLMVPQPATADPPAATTHSAGACWMRLAASLVLTAACVPIFGLASWRPDSRDAQVRFPAALGGFRLERTWTERLDSGIPIFSWGEYAAPGVDGRMEMGISPALGAHDTLLCHVARGERWQWHGPVTLPTASGPVAFTATEMDDGVVTALEATTLCTASGCGQWSSKVGRFGLVYSRIPLAGGVRSDDPPIPLLLRVELPDEQTAGVDPRDHLLKLLEAFSRYAPFDAFKYRYLRP